MATRGRTLPLCRTRRLVMDFLHFSHPTTTIAVERHADLADVAAARAAADPCPGWYAILLKAYALAAREVPDLRRSLLTFPWLRLYEHAESTALVTVERDVDGAPAVLTYPLRRPEAKSLAEIGAELEHARTAPVREVTAFRRALFLSRVPRPIRRLLLWLALRVTGRWRERYFGTFTASSVAPAAALTLALGPHTTFFAPAAVCPDGRTTLRVFFDHRVTDGAPVARALVAVEGALHGPILRELREMACPVRSLAWAGL
jgi:hypothetical protein